ncbi:SDR family NAD(P)-dependent oxidoreductase [Actinophytocola gossypii]|uniref:SDR family NAD(P)-dependent oxidoreductase n=1 Tax=Actinophytocola gossypii TaxID=2812003 RepID=A0ABT2JIG2_9PSEU|nr:SDR family NAD(P)-dependent oxidoreductase [Actinophytocola gossypii]MCT2587185.1 SDR family NAD(P)-dependent oxidoreductase [Actinophytocola gossypii]
MSDELTPVPPATVALVSGASRGLGLAMVADLLERGVRVAAFARTVTPELVDLSARFPETSHVGSVDITDAAAGQAFVREVEAKLGVVDALVNNAAIGQDSLHVHTSADRIERIVETNLTAPLLLTRFWLRRLLGKGGRGRLVNVTSICGQRGYPGLVAYSATKGGLDAATRSLAREFSGRVLANAVAPGFFASEMSAVLGQNQLDAILRRTPSGRLTTPEEVVPVVRMLLLEDTNINGQTIVIDGAGSV